MSIPVSGVRAIAVAEAIPLSREKSLVLELVFGLQPILQLTPWEAAALQKNFVSASPDLGGTYLKLAGLSFLASGCHTESLLS
jgi:hypothetical protein